MRFAAYMLAFASAAGAIAQDAARPLTVNELVTEALHANPEILAAQKRYEAARQRPAQERALPDPTLSLGWNASGNPLPGAGLGVDPTSNIGGMATQEIPYPGKLRLRAEVAAREADAEAHQYRTVELSVIARVKAAFYRLQHAYAMGDVLASNQDVLRTLLRVTEARYSVGKTAQADVFRAQTQLTLIETRLAQIDRERRSRAAELNALLNHAPTAPVARPSDPHIMPVMFTLDDLLAAAARRAPVLARDQKMIERAETALSLARKDYYPDFAVNGGYYYMGSMRPMYMFRADIKLPIRLGKTHAEVAERTQQVSEAKHSYEATARDLEYRIQDDFAAAETAHKLLELYSKTVMPQARLAVESSLSAYQTGGIDFASVLANQVAVFDYEMNYHEQMQEYHLAVTRLEEMTGMELTK